MNDERIVKVIEGCFVPDSNRGLAADAILAALRGAGFDVVDRDDLSGLTMMAERLVSEVRYFDDHKPSECAIVRTAEYVETALQRLVPVGGDS